MAKKISRRGSCSAASRRSRRRCQLAGLVTTGVGRRRTTTTRAHGPRGDDRQTRRRRPAGPTDLDALPDPAARAAAPARPRARVHADRGRPADRGRAGRLLRGVDVQRHRSRADYPRDRGRPAPRQLRRTAARHPHTIHFHGIHPANMDGVFEVVASGRHVHVRVPGAAVRDAALPLPLDAAEEAHPQGALRRLHHRPARAAPARAGARHGDQRLRHRRRRLEQLLLRQRARVLLREVPDQGQPASARPDLPREPDRVRPDQLVPPARRVLPLLPHRLDRPVRVHGHGDALPGRALDRSRSSSTTPARSCSTRTSPSSPSSAGWASSTSE